MTKARRNIQKDEASQFVREGVHIEGSENVLNEIIPFLTELESLSTWLHNNPSAILTLKQITPLLDQMDLVMSVPLKQLSELPEKYQIEFFLSLHNLVSPTYLRVLDQIERDIKDFGPDNMGRIRDNVLPNIKYLKENFFPVVFNTSALTKSKYKMLTENFQILLRKYKEFKKVDAVYTTKRKEYKELFEQATKLGFVPPALISARTNHLEDVKKFNQDFITPYLGAMTQSEEALNTAKKQASLENFVHAEEQMEITYLKGLDVEGAYKNRSASLRNDIETLNRYVDAVKQDPILGEIIKKIDKEIHRMYFFGDKSKKHIALKELKKTILEKAYYNRDGQSIKDIIASWKEENQAVLQEWRLNPAKKAWRSVFSEHHPIVPSPAANADKKRTGTEKFVDDLIKQYGDKIPYIRFDKNTPVIPDANNLFTR